MIVLSAAQLTVLVESDWRPRMESHVKRGQWKSALALLAPTAVSDSFRDGSRLIASSRCERCSFHAIEETRLRRRARQRTNIT